MSNEEIKRIKKRKKKKERKRRNQIDNDINATSSILRLSCIAPQLKHSSPKERGGIK
jgi:hypothetical protein